MKAEAVSLGTDYRIPVKMPDGVTVYVRPLSIFETIEVNRLKDKGASDNRITNMILDNLYWQSIVVSKTFMRSESGPISDQTDQYFADHGAVLKLSEQQLKYLYDQYLQVEDLTNPFAPKLETLSPAEIEKEVERRKDEIKKNYPNGRSLSTSELEELIHFLLAKLEAIDEPKPSSEKKKKISPLDNIPSSTS